MNHLLNSTGLGPQVPVPGHIPAVGSLSAEFVGSGAHRVTNFIVYLSDINHVKVKGQKIREKKNKKKYRKRKISNFPLAWDCVFSWLFII